MPPTTTTLRVALTDPAMDELHARAQVANKDPETLAARTLEGALRVVLPRSGRYVVVEAADLDVLEQIFSGGSVLNSQDLRQKVERLAGISFGHVRLDFSPGQLEEIARRAERQGLEPEELIRRCAKKMDELFFTHLGLGV
jgi:hypothetical protein